ncbi:Sortilin, neurotensin receptor 3 [anaerobic digester metagenome]
MSSPLWLITRIKTLLFVLLLVILSQPSFAQEHWMAKFGHLGNYYDIKDATQQYFREDPTRIDNKACGYKSFNRWMVYMESRVDANGTLNTYKTAMVSVSQALQNRAPNSNYPVNWEVFGPTNNSHATRANMGLITSIWVNEDNPDNIYAGSNSGGLFVTNNNGQNWQCLTDKYLINGIESIDIHKNRPGVIYIGTGTETFGRACGFGVWKSTDNGLTWNETGLNSQTFTGNFFTKTAQDPVNPDRLYAIVNFENTSTPSKILRTTNGGNSWEINYSIAPFLREIEIDKSNPAKVYASGSGLYFSSNYGASWNDITHKIVPDINNYKVIRASVAINPFNSQRILVLRQVKRLDNNEISSGIMLSVDGGNTFTLQSLVNVDNSYLQFFTMHAGNWMMELEWSKEIMDHFYIGGLWIHKYKLTSNNQFERVRIAGDVISWNASYDDLYHIDTRELKTYLIDGVGYIYNGNDGGITKGTEIANGNVEWQDISKSGLNITQYWGFGITDDGSDFIAGGTQDGNFNIHENGSWRISGGDVYENVVDYSNPDIIYRTSPFSEMADPPRALLEKSTNKGNDWTIIRLNENLSRNDKPIEMSQSNPLRVYVGGSNVWRTNNGNDFQQISNFTYQGKLKSIREAPSNPLVIYAAMENPTWQYTPANNVDRLYKTIDGGNTWVDITPNVSHAYLAIAGITDIAIDPADPHTFYLTLGNNWEGMKVFKGVGITSIIWTNISEGLFNLPVNCIKLRPVNDLQELFIGTDDGVYYRNKNMTSWEPFGNGLPITLVSDIDYDYATHQIYVATFGRGIFKADLSNFNLPPNGGDIIVTTNETWSMLKRIPANVIVKQGATLTITGVVKMKESKQIIVEKGAKLIVDGGVIRNHVKDTFWKGIVVHGTDGPQNPLYQGIVALKNNAVIENAEIGVLAKWNTSFSGGGIVSASNATFKNNIKAVEFTPYKYGYSISSFSLCDFYTTTQMPVNYDPIAFVTLESIDGVKFKGCKFINERSTAPEKLGKGINSHNSYFFVDHKCSGSQVPCPANEYQKSEFIMLKYGIYSNNILPGKPFKVNNSYFKHNECGIYAAATSNIEIKLNEFDIKLLYAKNTGLYLDRCTGYIVEENSFSNEVASYSNELRGIVVNQSGAENNMIYKNLFHQLELGIVSQDLNRSSNGSTGLMLKCNIFTGLNWPKRDIAIYKTDPNATGMGIASYQGINGSDCESPAGNLFANSPSDSYYSIYNDGERIYYHYHKNEGNDPPWYPKKISGPITRTMTRHLYSIDCCPPNTTGGGGISIIDAVTAAHKEEADNKTETLNSLIDEGETTDKLLEVNLASPGEALEVRNSLLQTSPYVSDTVLKLSIKREELFNNAMIRDIMVANPQSAKSETLIQELDMRLEPMPEYMRDEILEGVFVLSARELMEAKRDIEMQFYNYGFNRLLSAALTDTIPVPVDTLLALLAADGSARSLMQQAWIMLENGDTLSAANRMASIPTEVSFSETEAKEHTEQQAFMQSLIQHPVISEEQFEDLGNFVESPSIQVSASALSLMVAHQLLDYQEPYLVPDLTKSMEVKKPKAKPAVDKSNLLKVYPNPANEFITIEYNAGSAENQLMIEVIDEKGRLVYNTKLIRSTDQIIIDTRNFKSGNYIIRLVSGNKSIGNTNVIISR